MSAIKTAILLVLEDLGRTTYPKMITELRRRFGMDWYNAANRSALLDLINDGLVNASVTKDWIEKA